MANHKRIQQDIEFLRNISEPCEAGTTRIGFTPEYREGVEYVKSRMKEIGLAVREDHIGNIYGLLEGLHPDKPVILSGSHLDTVRCAGAFDGISGVICALEAARMLKENGHILKHSYEVMGIIEEEGTRFNQALLGSQYITGEFGEEQMDQFQDADGITLRQAITNYSPGGIVSAYRTRDSVMAFLELHDEQGPVLENEGIDIGIVEGIVAISWLTVTVTGFAGHSGTVPMPVRQDAGIGAFHFITRANHHVTSHYPDNATLTVGQLSLSPGSSNCIPSKCVFTMDLRSAQEQNVHDITNYIKETAALISKEYHVEIQIQTDPVKQPVYMNAELQILLEHCCDKLGLSHRRMGSGAGHDAMVFSKYWKTAMVFVPCVKGITHHPDECVHWDALENGTNLLYETILKLDEQE